MNTITTRLIWSLAIALALSLGYNGYQAWKLNCPGCAAREAEAAAPLEATKKPSSQMPRPESAATPPVEAPAPTAAAARPAPPEEPARPQFVSPGPTGTPTPPDSEEDKEKQKRAWLSDFDRAMDREYMRLEEREKSPRDADDLNMIRQLKDKLTALDALYIKADQTTNPEDRFKLDTESQQLMGEIIQLGRADRNQLLSKLAHSYGITEEAQIVAFIQAIDRVYADTHLDWAKLFSRGP